MQRLPRLNLHLKIMVVLGLVFLPVIVATGYLPFQNEKQFLLLQAKRRAGDLVRSLDLITQASIGAPGLEPLRTFAERTFYEDQDVVAIEVRGVRQDVLTAAGPRNRADDILRFKTTRAVYRGRDQVATIELTYSLTGAKLNLEWITRVVGLSVIDAFLCLAFVLHLAFKYLVTQRLARLMRHSEVVAAGDLKQRVDEGAADELGLLARSFNRMTDALDRSRTQIEEINRDLERRVNERTAQLANEKALTESIIASMADGLITFDAARRLTGMNAAAEALIGVKASEAIGRQCFEIVQCEVCASRCLHNRAVETGGPVVEPDVMLEKTSVPIAFSSALLRGPDGTIVGGVETLRDIGPMKHLFAQVQRADRLSTVGTLAAGIAHELNNPIGNISTFAQLLAERENPDPEFTKKSLATIASETNRAGFIIRGLLDFSRQTPIRREPLNLATVVDRALKIVSSAFLSKACYDVRWTPTDMPPVRADANQMLQVFINLLTNAFQAMPGGGTLTIEAPHEPVSRDGGEYLAIRVVDSGEGIPAENLDRLFDPFFTTKQVGKGTGLGLSVSYGIVLEHSGFIDVQSQPGAGSTFTVFLPIDREVRA